MVDEPAIWPTLVRLSMMQAEAGEKLLSESGHLPALLNRLLTLAGVRSRVERETAMSNLTDYVRQQDEERRKALASRQWDYFIRLVTFHDPDITPDEVREHLGILSRRQA
jgi:hypothetical protein